MSDAWQYQVADAVEISMRATRRLDQMQVAQKETIGLAAGARGSKVRGARVDEKPRLAEAAVRTAAEIARRLPGNPGALVPSSVTGSESPRLWRARWYLRL